MSFSENYIQEENHQFQGCPQSETNGSCFNPEQITASKGWKISPNDKPVFIALQDVFTKFPIRLQDFETIIEGMEDDLFPVMCNTWDELRSYCYKVASAVGLILIEIYGYEDRAARLHAIDLRNSNATNKCPKRCVRRLRTQVAKYTFTTSKEVLASHNIDELCRPYTKISNPGDVPPSKPILGYHS